MKLKCKFTYKCEIEVKKEEIEILKEKFTANKEEFLEDLASEVNDFILFGDGRTEAGMIADFKLEVE